MRSVASVLLPSLSFSHISSLALLIGCLFVFYFLLSILASYILYLDCFFLGSYVQFQYKASTAYTQTSQAKMPSLTPISYSFKHYPTNNNHGDSNSNSNTIVPDDTNHQQTSEAEPSCEFTSPCTTTSSSSSPTKNSSTQITGKHPRKIISHIFGRNKFVTKLIPPSVWVHYCRKHYQRARYRSTQWPFTQAELLLDSLGRMERWGGVRGFELVLRRREVERVDKGYGQGEIGHARTRKSARVSATAKCQEQGDGNEGGENGNTGSTSASSIDHDHDHDQPSSDEHTCTNIKGKGKGCRKKPNIESAPVPDWLRQEVGPNKSFEDIRGIVSRLLEYLTVLREQGRKEEIRFPDIEILPELEGWVFKMDREMVKKARAAAGGGRKGGQVKKGGKRVSERGAVQKV